MEKEAELRAAIHAAQEAYRAEANTAAPSQLRELTGRARALQAELAAHLSEGAAPCRCGATPIGMLRTPATGRAPAIYEVGCPTCTAACKGLTPRQAVASWNAGEFSFPPAVPTPAP